MRERMKEGGEDTHRVVTEGVLQVSLHQSRRSAGMRAKDSRIHAICGVHGGFVGGEQKERPQTWLLDASLFGFYHGTSSFQPSMDRSAEETRRNTSPIHPQPFVLRVSRCFS